MENLFKAFDDLVAKFHFSEEAQSYIEEIKKNFSQDFAAPYGQYYSHENLQQLVRIATEKLADILSSHSQPIQFSNLRDAWSSVVVNFHQNKRWGVATQKQKPAKVLTEDQKIFRELVPYFALIVIVAFTVKTAFFYYGMHSASNPTTENKVWLGITLAMFFTSMFYFAFKKRK